MLVQRDTSCLKSASRVFGLALLAVVSVTAWQSAAAQTELILYGFEGSPYPQPPEDINEAYGGLIMDNQGNLIGVGGGGYSQDHEAQDSGAIFQIYPFGYENDGIGFGDPPYPSSPNVGLVMDQHGNLYGTSAGGGSYYGGTVFKASENSADPTVLFNFNPASGYAYPTTGVAMDSDGNLYGTARTYSPGCGVDNQTYNSGVVFKVTPAGMFSVLHTFTGGLDGCAPGVGLLTFGKDGNLYGVTSTGGPFGMGTIFKVTPAGAETVLYSFGADLAKGISPQGPLVFDSQGNIYGTTLADGSGKHGNGTAFKLAPDGTLTVLHTFYSYDLTPTAGVVIDNNGNLYGTTTSRSYLVDPLSSGQVYKVAQDGTFTVLHSFPQQINYPEGEEQVQPDGVSPSGWLLIDARGNLYGTTMGGGASTDDPTIHANGIVYEITSETTAKPVLSPGTGTYHSSPQTITITDATPYSKIYYTTQYGDTATTKSTLYSGPFTMDAMGSVSAIAVSPRAAPSVPVNTYYQFRVNEPTFNYGGGRYSMPLSLVISEATPGAAIYYTTDGSTPTASSTKYTGPITVGKSGTVRAVGILAQYENSTVGATTLTIY